MGLRHLIPVLLLIQLHGFTKAASPLPQLAGNRLSEGTDRELPNATPISCGRSEVVAGRTQRKRTVAQALTTSNFGTYPFTAGPVGSPQSPRITGPEGKFTFAEVKGTKYVYALQVDPTGERAYWLPQGGTIDIPRNPTAHQPKYVFTPDFSGCSWTVTPLANGNLRLRHVEGGREAAQFNNLTPAQKGGGTTYAMQYKDYGYLVETRRLVGNIPSFSFMHYSGGSWMLTFQRKTCSSTLGGFVFKNHLLSSATMVDSRSTYRAVSGTKEYRIP